MLFRRRVTIIILLSACAYGSAYVLNHPVPSFQQDWLVFALLWLAPFILCIGSIKSWHRCYTWRLMLDNRNVEPVLSRGKHLQTKYESHPHILEYICCTFFLLSLAAILKLLGVEHILWIITASIFSIFLLCKAIGKS